MVMYMQIRPEVSCRGYLASGGPSDSHIETYRTKKVSEPPDDLGACLRIGCNDEHGFGEDEAFPHGP